MAVGLIAVLRGRDGNIFSGLPLWLVLSIGAGLGLCLWLAHKHADRLFSYVRRRA